jgi:hypothetical protein
MDWLRISIERFFAFLATVIPGGSVLLLFVLHKQPALETLWKTESLNYETKIAVTVLCTFTAGFAIQDALTRLSGGVGGFIRGYFNLCAKQEINDNDVQPWRNPVWRALLKSYLGRSAPEDVEYIYSEAFEKNLELISLGPDENKAARALEAMRNKAGADAVDYEWATWWRRLHLPALLRLHSPYAVMVSNLSGNFQSASLILLLGMIWTPELRHWWIVVFSLYWIVSMGLQLFYLGRSGLDWWSSFEDQLQYLESRLFLERKDIES